MSWIQKLTWQCLENQRIFYYCSIVMNETSSSRHSMVGNCSCGLRFWTKVGQPLQTFCRFCFQRFHSGFSGFIDIWSRWYFDSCLELSGNVSSKRRGFILNITSSGINGFARQWMTKAQEYSWPRFERVFYLFLEAMGPSRWSRCFSFNVEGREFIIFFVRTLEAWSHVTFILSWFEILTQTHDSLLGLNFQKVTHFLR